MHEIVDQLRRLMSPETQKDMIVSGGYALLAAIIFSETGLLIGFFLPGDSLLFTAGMVASAPSSGIDIVTLNVLLVIMAIVGDAVGYAFGRFAGQRLYEREQTLLFRRDHLLATRAFYEKHGGKTIVMARFIPFARTFAPVVAGIANMPYSRFVAYNVVGGLGWVVSMSLFGYFVGSQLGPKNAERVVYLIILVSLLPVFVAWLKNRGKPAAPAA